MWKLLTRVVNAAEMRTIIAWFVAAAVLQGLTLALMIPFLRALYSRSALNQPRGRVRTCSAMRSIIVSQTSKTLIR